MFFKHGMLFLLSLLLLLLLLFVVVVVVVAALNVGVTVSSRPRLWNMQIQKGQRFLDNQAPNGTDLQGF